MSPSLFSMNASPRGSEDLSPDQTSTEIYLSRAPEAGEELSVTSEGELSRQIESRTSSPADVSVIVPDLPQGLRGCTGEK